MFSVDISVDDGFISDTKVIEILKDFDLTAIFFLPILSFGAENIELYKNFQIGGHTWSHPLDLKMLDEDSLNFEIGMAKQELEKRWGQTIQWFCPPRGRGGEREKMFVQEAGFSKYRTTLVGCVDNCLEPFVVNTTVHLFPRKEYEGKDIVLYAKEKLDQAKAHENGYFHLWFHSLELDRLNLWNDLIEILKLIKAA